MHQQDLFDDGPPSAPSNAPGPTITVMSEADALQTRFLAAPCGFVNRGNRPCQRRATLPLLLDGVQLVHRGFEFLHCDPACWRDAAAGSETDGPDRDVSGKRADDEDPGWHGAPPLAEEDWSRWERVDDHGLEDDAS